MKKYLCYLLIFGILLSIPVVCAAAEHGVTASCKLHDHCEVHGSAPLSVADCELCNMGSGACVQHTDLDALSARVEQALIDQSGWTAPSASAVTDPYEIDSATADSAESKYDADAMDDYNLTGTEGTLLSYNTKSTFEAGEDYVYVEGQNLRNVKMPIGFKDKLAIGDNPAPVAALGNTKEYNLCPPQDGVTILVFFRNDCYYYSFARKFFQWLSLASWVDDPRIRIMAVDCTNFDNGGYPMRTEDFAKKYAYGCYQSIEWYAASSYLHEITWMSRFEKYGIGKAWVGILSHGETTDVYGNTIPAYTMDYVGSDMVLERPEMLENTLSYIFPDLEQSVGQFTLPENETWTVDVVGDRDYGAAQKIYEKLEAQRQWYWLEEYYRPLTMDAALTEIAMQRAAEIAIHYDHVRPDGREMKTVYGDFGYTWKNDYGENISFTTVVDDLSTEDKDESVDNVYQGWVDSPAHFNNMMSIQFGKVGVGCFRVGDRSFWVQVFDGTDNAGEPLCERTDVVETVTSVKTTTDKLNVKVKRGLHSTIGEPYGYIITHEGGSITYRYSLQLAIQNFDSVIKAQDGSTLATAIKEGPHLSITTQKLGSGTMNITFAPEQKNAIVVTVNGKSPNHTHAYTKWGRWQQQGCIQEGFDRRYCSCGHYEQSEMYPIVHSWVEREGKEPTCLTTGLTTFIECEICYKNKTEQEVIPAKGHTSVVEEPEDPPKSCTDYGKTSLLRCSVCQQVTQWPELISPLPHTLEVIPAVEPTCATEGNTQGERCKVCGTNTIVPIPIEKTQHTWQTLEAVAATCQSTGLTEGYGCIGCGAIVTKQEVVPKTSCRIVTFPGKPATCQGPGYTDYSACGDCGREMASPIVIPQRGHSYKKVAAKEPTCTEDGHTECKVCTMCGVPQNPQEVIPKLGHAYSNDSDSTCNNCGEEREVESKPLPQRGDLDNDGKVSAKDALEVLKITVGKLIATEAQQLAADVNQDGTVGAADAL
ncbi:MAG: hypothetical protein IKT68_01725, partial [Clostridia bacterium]|nr:hypothetical protein [Clostridia bacterium]